MTGKVHLEIGAATAACTYMIIGQDDLRTMIGGIGLCCLGALIPDIDAPRSTIKKVYKKIITTIMCTIILSAMYIYFNKINFIDVANYLKGLLQNDTRILGAILFLVACAIGRLSNHRTITHCLIGMVAYSVPIYLMFGGYYTIYFSLGMLSHNIADMLNNKKIQFLYPLKLNCSLYLCNADSRPSRVIGYISILIFCVVSFYNVYNF